eukprot:SAG31_NODE_7736_length_1606_cov_1.401460_3_plen_93_part_01
MHATAADTATADADFDGRTDQLDPALPLGRGGLDPLAADDTPRLMPSGDVELLHAYRVSLIRERQLSQGLRARLEVCATVAPPVQLTVANTPL